MKDYTQFKKAEMNTPKSVMGSQGNSVTIKPEHWKARSTGSTPFPGGKKSK